VGLSSELAVSALAVVASTTTAIVSMIVTSRSQRAAVREQSLWKERTDTYLGLQAWIQAIYDWSDRKLRKAPPPLDRNTELRVSLFSGPFVVDHFVGMKQVIEALKQAARDEEWEKFHDLQWQLSDGWAIDLRSLLRDELQGRVAS
jgi:hypothetical protein